MTALIHSDFLTSDNAYQRAESFWHELWHALSPTAETLGWHSPWLANSDRDGNPIFSAVCERLHRGLRIIQEEADEDETPALDWWLDCFGIENETDSIRHLVISCVPGHENLHEIQNLITQWVGQGLCPSPDTAPIPGHAN